MDPRIQTNFGAIMEMKGISIGRLEREAGISRNTARAFRRDKLARLDLRTLGKVVVALDVKIDEVIKILY